MKSCTKCKEIKSLDFFYQSYHNKNKKHYYRSQCKECEKSRMRVGHIKRSYGIEQDKYLQMLAQGCAICGSQENLCVDHDHSCCPGIKSCGRCVRGILCQSHNKAEGLLSSADEAYKLYLYMGGNPV